MDNANEHFAYPWIVNSINHVQLDDFACIFLLLDSLSHDVIEARCLAFLGHHQLYKS